MTPRTFWMVYVSHKNSPTKRHPSEASAITEAQRLALLNKGFNVYVLEAQMYCHTEEAPIVWTDL